MTTREIILERTGIELQTNDKSMSDIYLKQVVTRAEEYLQARGLEIINVGLEKFVEVSYQIWHQDK